MGFEEVDSGKIAAAAALIDACLAGDTAAGWRLELHTALANTFVHYNLYQVRHVYQIGLLFVLGLLLLYIGRGVFSRFRSRPGARLAAFGLLLSSALWGLEVISLHQTDQVLYHLWGGCMTVAYLWVLAAVLTALGAFLDVLRRDRKRACCS
ncbi:hypothetical protein [Silvibacterium dinghuense]|uniref:Uncharacterized protein n=1 Tax=Silvibacterium dinghuense TaxID=1560006 RepID=A0A4Q1SH89_9BACT|nr:hypothetical protein [Silvibacterium dinghuense]RXS96739.1 hypothetical protein ESZ00_01970 [Silvibacterium dinghuense]